MNINIRIQLIDFETAKETQQHKEALETYCKILKLRLQKVENRHYDNSFVVSFPKETAFVHWQINGVIAFCMLNDVPYDFVDDHYLTAF